MNYIIILLIIINHYIIKIIQYRLNSIINSKKNITGVGVFIYDLNNTLIIIFTGYVPASLHFNCSPFRGSLQGLGLNMRLLSILKMVMYL